MSLNHDNNICFKTIQADQQTFTTILTHLNSVFSNRSMNSSTSDNDEESICLDEFAMQSINKSIKYETISPLDSIDIEFKPQEKHINIKQFIPCATSKTLFFKTENN